MEPRLLTMLGRCSFTGLHHSLPSAVCKQLTHKVLQCLTPCTLQPVLPGLTHVLHTSHCKSLSLPTQLHYTECQDSLMFFTLHRVPPFPTSCTTTLFQTSLAPYTAMLAFTGASVVFSTFYMTLFFLNDSEIYKDRDRHSAYFPKLLLKTSPALLGKGAKELLYLSFMKQLCESLISPARS